MNYLNAILLDPYVKKLTKVNVGTDNTLQDMYKHIGCNLVEVVSFGDVNDLWVDEEGLLKRDQSFFKVSNLPFGHHGVIVGRALLLKCGDSGGCESTTLSIEDVLPRISWDFTHNNKFYDSETGLFTEVEFDTSELRKVFDVHEDRQKDIVDSIKSIHVIE